MTDKQTLLDLAAQCGTATGPDRLLDAEVTIALRIPHPNGIWSLNFPRWEPDETDKGRVWAVSNVNGNGSHRSGSWVSQPYTASIDAASMLVPEGMAWDCTSHGDATVYVCPGKPDASDFRQWDTEAATPALALLAACLKAKAGEVT
jgi:hypothetical protein